MAHRALLPFVLALVFLFAGCTAPEQGAPDEGNDNAGEDDEGEEGPFAGLVPGIEELPLPSGAQGLVQGIVYDVTTGEALSDASVVATCVRQALPTLGGEAPTKTLPVGPDGSFTMWAPVSFSDCVRVQYTVEAAGYEMVVPLESGDLARQQQIVNAGMVPVVTDG